MFKKCNKFIGHGLIALGLILSFLPAPSARAAGCDDLAIIFARGSGGAIDDSNTLAWEAALTAALSPYRVSYHFYRLGTNSYAGAQYPAVAIDGDFAGLANLLGAYIGSGMAYAFGASVRAGQRELFAYITLTHATCPNTKFILGGYSQGAMVISGILPSLDPSQIVYAATFGDPKLYLPEGQRTPLTQPIPDACYGRNLSNYRLDVADCFAYIGVLGGYEPYQPAGYTNKLGTWCKDADIMCSAGLSLDDHLAYVSANLYADAAQVIAARVGEVFPQRVSVSIAKPLHELAILLDVTGSMQPYLDAYREEAARLASKVQVSGGRVALYIYGDALIGEAPVQLCSFESAASCVNDALADLPWYSGGDAPESSLNAALTAMNDLNWTSGATKSLILLTDAKYHEEDAPVTTGGATMNDDDDGDDAAITPLTREMVVRRSLEIDPVNVYVLTTAAAADAYATLTSDTGGRVFDLSTEVALSTDVITSRPVARFATMSYLGLAGSEFTFDASRSYSPDGLEITFQWDLDGDGTFETAGSSAAAFSAASESASGTEAAGATFAAASGAVVTVPITSTRYVSVQVTDANGLSSTMSALVQVADSAAEVEALRAARLGDLSSSNNSSGATAAQAPGAASASSGAAAQIASLSATAKGNGAYAVQFSAAAERIFLALDDALLGELDLSAIATCGDDGLWRGAFTIGDVTQPTTLTLIPYSSARGASASVTLGADNSAGLTDSVGAADSDDVTSSFRTDGYGSAGISDSATSSSASTDDSVPADAYPLDRIKVPNSGVRSF